MSALEGVEAGLVPTLAWVAAAWVRVCPTPSLPSETLCSSRGQPSRATQEPRAGHSGPRGAVRDREPPVPGVA